MLGLTKSCPDALMSDFPTLHSLLYSSLYILPLNFFFFLLHAFLLFSFRSSHRSVHSFPCPIPLLHPYFPKSFSPLQSCSLPSYTLTFFISVEPHFCKITHVHRLPSLPHSLPYQFSLSLHPSSFLLTTSHPHVFWDSQSLSCSHLFYLPLPLSLCISDTACTWRSDSPVPSSPPTITLPSVF